jgi:hypothetical protein
MTRTIVALYDDLSMAQHVVTDLVKAGVPRDNISLVANDVTGQYGTYVGTDAAGTDDAVTADEGAGFGAVVGALTGALVSLGALAVPGVGPVLAAGPLLAALGGGAIGAVAGAATGGIVAGLVKTGVSEQDARYYAEGVRRGGAVLSATVEDSTAPRVQEIMNRHNPVSIDQRAEYWRSSGWNTFDEKAKPYSSEQIYRDREDYRSYMGRSTTPTTPTSKTSSGGCRTYDKAARV